MANNIIAMDSIKKEAIKVYNGMMVIDPHIPEGRTLSTISELASKFNGCYATNNSTICFVSEGEVFVIPYTRITMLALHSAGFRENYFYVPFSNGDYPKAEQLKWRALREKAHQSYKDDFVRDCEAYCDKRHIGAISEETLANCFEMPETGVMVEHLYFKNTYYPIMCQTCLDCRCDNLGHYTCNNGRVVFVYRNGKTYVTKGYGILKELCAAGYTESSLFVPFSNGEQIKDPTLRARWESIAKK